MSNIKNNQNESINDTQDPTFHTACEDMDKNLSIDDINQQHLMNKCYGSFVKNINTTDGRRLFNSFMAGDYATSTKLTVYCQLRFIGTFFDF